MESFVDPKSESSTINLQQLLKYEKNLKILEKKTGVCTFLHFWIQTQICEKEIIQNLLKGLIIL